MTTEERLAKLEAQMAGIELHFGQSFAAAAPETEGIKPNVDMGGGAAGQERVNTPLFPLAATGLAADPNTSTSQ